MANLAGAAPAVLALPDDEPARALSAAEQKPQFEIEPQAARLTPPIETAARTLAYLCPPGYSIALPEHLG